jgi:MFS family permease
VSSTVTAPAPVHPVASVPGPLPRFRCVALGVVWSAYLVVFLSRLCVGPLSPFLKQAFDLSNAQIGGLTSATAITYAPTLVLAGWLVDRIGVRRAGHRRTRHGRVRGRRRWCASRA